MRILGLVFGLASLASGCGEVELPRPPNLVDTERETALRWVIDIEKSRSSASVAISNLGPEAVICNGLTYRAIFDFPVSYLEAGETSRGLLSAYLRPGETRTFPTVTVDGSEKQIRSIQGGSFDSCKVAKFSDYCRLPSLSLESKSFFQDLFRQTDVASCEDLNAKITQTRVIDLRRSDQGSYEALRALNVDVVTLISESQSQRMADDLRRIEHVADVVIFRDDCADNDVESLLRKKRCRLDENEEEPPEDLRFRKNWRG